MNVPAVVDAALDGESVATRVPLRGEDALFVTGTRTLAYRADGLLSDESVEEYPHGAERLTVSEGRRKSKVVLDYGLDGEKTLSVPASKLDDALHPILAGVLNHANVTQPGETVKRTYRFSELTLIVTSDRLVKHIGSAVWDDDYEEIAFADVTDRGVEEGTVASQLVLETTGRTQRIKAPNESFRDVRETVEDALYAAHDADTYEAFRRTVASDPAPEEARADVTFDSDLEPLGGRTEEAVADAEDDAVDAAAADTTTAEPVDTETASADTRTKAESASPTDAAPPTESTEAASTDGLDANALREELDALVDAVAEQQTVIEDQQSLIEDQQAVVEEQQDRLRDQRERIESLRDAIPDQ